MFKNGDRSSGIRTIYPYNNTNISAKVFCDQDTDGGGWTVILRRIYGENRINFMRNWNEYSNGFGNIEKEFYAGNNLIHALTTSSKQQLRIDLADYEGNEKYAKYNFFKVDDAASNYVLNISGFYGNAGDSLKRHNGEKFATVDKDYIGCANK